MDALGHRCTGQRLPRLRPELGAPAGVSTCRCHRSPTHLSAGAALRATVEVGLHHLRHLQGAPAGADGFLTHRISTRRNAADASREHLGVKRRMAQAPRPVQLHVPAGVSTSRPPHGSTRRVAQAALLRPCHLCKASRGHGDELLKV